MVRINVVNTLISWYNVLNGSIFYLTTETESIKSVGAIHEEGAAWEKRPTTIKNQRKSFKIWVSKKRKKEITAISSYFVSAINKK